MRLGGENAETHHDQGDSVCINGVGGLIANVLGLLAECNSGDSYHISTRRLSEIPRPLFLNL